MLPLDVLYISMFSLGIIDNNSGIDKENATRLAEDGCKKRGWNYITKNTRSTRFICLENRDTSAPLAHKILSHVFVD